MKKLIAKKLFEKFGKVNWQQTEITDLPKFVEEYNKNSFGYECYDYEVIALCNNELIIVGFSDIENYNWQNKTKQSELEIYYSKLLNPDSIIIGMTKAGNWYDNGDQGYFEKNFFIFDKKMSAKDFDENNIENYILSISEIL